MTETSNSPLKPDQYARRRAGGCAALVLPAAGGLIAVVALVGLVFWQARADVDFAFERELAALLTSALFVLLGLSVIGMVRQVFPELTFKGDGLLIAVLLVPILVYLVLAGRIANFSAGGVEVNLYAELATSVPLGNQRLADHGAPGTNGGSDTDSAAAPHQPCATDARGTVVPDAFTLVRQIRDLGAVAPLGDTSQMLAPDSAAPPAAGPNATKAPTPTATPAAAAGGPVVFLQLTVDDCDYGADPLATRVATLARSDGFKFVVLVYDPDKFYASIPAGIAVDLLAADADSFAAAIRDDPAALRVAAKFPGIEFTALGEDDTTLAALQEMRASNLDALVIVDKAGDVAGVVTLDQVTASMLVELATNGGE